MAYRNDQNSYQASLIHTASGLSISDALHQYKDGQDLPKIPEIDDRNGRLKLKEVYHLRDISSIEEFQKMSLSSDDVHQQG